MTLGALTVAASLITAAATAAADSDVPESAAPSSAGTVVSVTAGGQLGVLFPYGVYGAATYQRAARRAWDLDLIWQPSAGWQSYSVGLATRPLHGVLFAGMRVRYVQLHPPWSRGFDGSVDHQLGIGAELGVRVRVGSQRQFEITAAVGAFAIASGDTRLPVLYTTSVGIGYELWTKGRFQHSKLSPREAGKRSSRAPTAQRPH